MELFLTPTMKCLSSSPEADSSIHLRHCKYCKCTQSNIHRMQQKKSSRNEIYLTSPFAAGTAPTQKQCYARAWVCFHHNDVQS